MVLCTRAAPPFSAEAQGGSPPEVLPGEATFPSWGLLLTRGTVYSRAFHAFFPFLLMLFIYLFIHPSNKHFRSPRERPGTVISIENTVVNQTNIFMEASVAAVEGAR